MSATWTESSTRAFTVSGPPKSSIGTKVTSLGLVPTLYSSLRPGMP